jgi:FtsZ-binding cell division protein ZapB
MEGQSSNRNIVIFLTIITAILAVSLGFLALRYNTMLKDNQIAQGAVEEQKNSLAKDLNNMMVEYDNLKTNNDSMNFKITEQQDHIKKLLNIQASNLEKIRLYKNELSTLRTVLRSYVVQIDSLNQRNQLLYAENKDVKYKLNDAQRSNETLTSEKQTLTTKVQTAAVLSAKGISFVALNKKGKETDRASKATKLKICFTIRENSIAEAGTRSVFMRITGPNKSVLAISPDNVIKVDGNDVTFSARREVEYENKDVDMCIFWDNSSTLLEGTYVVDLFCEGKLIGNTTFGLK